MLRMIRMEKKMLNGKIIGMMRWKGRTTLLKGYAQSWRRMLQSSQH